MKHQSQKCRAFVFANHIIISPTIDRCAPACGETKCRKCVKIRLSFHYRLPKNMQFFKMSRWQSNDGDFRLRDGGFQRCRTNDGGLTCMRIMTGIDDLEASDFFTMNSRETRGHGKKIMKQPSRLNLRKFSFFHRVVDDWNYLPSKVVEARDVEQFKAELDDAWKDIRFLHTAL